MLLAVVLVDTAGDELLLPSKDGVSEPCRAPATVRCTPNDDVVLDRRSGKSGATEPVALSGSSSSSSRMGSSLLS
jgi:hypothetical protein